jgi:hypothetical protein
MAEMTWRTLTIESDGTLTNTPSPMHGETGSGVAWFVNNESGVRVKLRIKDFKRKSSGNAIAPVDFFTDRVTVENGEVGMNVGQISLLPSSGSILTKYTIEVKSSLLNRDYDPDLEIDRPGS